MSRYDPELGNIVNGALDLIAKNVKEKEKAINPKLEYESIAELAKKLDYAKDAVRWLLDHSSGSVDLHGLAHWASAVERLRKEIQEGL